ncbi:MAG: D-isomer specific 2-hydroxyacid dehydrogenase, NAD-binding [Acidobacteria bacterium]|nr:D-isomer specific 2-hydroxyacid dehydrogenase, NAD-binding [Acidobacteriota bacterium]
MRLVVIAPPSYGPLARLREAAPPEVEITASDDPAVLRPAVAAADAVLVAPRLARLLREVWPTSSSVRWVHTLAAGVDTLLFPELIESEAVVTNARGVFNDALAEFVLAAVLYFAKDLPRMRRNQQAARWEPFNVRRIEGSTLGIIGYGSIGHSVARLAHAARMRVVAIRRRADAPADPLLARAYATSELADLMSASDYVVITAPLTDQTRGLVGPRELAALQSHAVLINIGRGPIVDEPALLAALTEQRIRGAALDVFNTEPLPPEHPLWRLDNVLLSPHTADHTDDAHDRSMEVYLGNLRRFLSGQLLENVVDKSARY